jgi:phosphoglucosamine mutase
MAGIVISASHNPFVDNGIKVFDENGYKLSDESEEQIEALIGNKADTPLVQPEHIGRQRRLDFDAGGEYIDFLQQAVPGLSLQGMNIVLDCSHGATYQVAPAVLEKLGARVVALFCSPDGVNINDNCGSQYPQHLSREVLNQGAHIGLAFDGDGDRLIAVDETGTILTGDQIMVICARHLLDANLLRNKAVVSTVMSNLGFHQALKEMGITSHITPVGDRYVIQKMLSEDAILGGEDSGHMIFRDTHTTGDGLMAALRLLTSIQAAGQPLSKLAQLMTVFPQVLVNVNVKVKPAIESIPEITAAIQKVENALGDRGRVLVRYSGTQNKCRVMVEGPTLEATKASCQEIVDVVRTVLANGK